MERELWPLLYRVVREVSFDFGQKYVQIPGWVLVLTMLWAALHDRPVSWACRPANWQTTRLRPARLPSPATMSRRIDTVGVGLLWRAIEQRLREQSAQHPALIALLDGKPLPVGGATKDPDARYGRGAGLMAKGYKLHAVWAKRALPETWEVTPMNTSEVTVAKRLLRQVHAGGYLLADGNYDGNELFDQAYERGYQMLTPAPSSGTGRGHRYHSPHRWRSIHLMRETTFGPSVYDGRIGIEQAYGQAVSFGGGLGPLPAWVRGLERVRTWVWAKLVINATRILRNKHLRHP
jgi:IS5 family transposase